MREIVFIKLMIFINKSWSQIIVESIFLLIIWEKDVQSKNELFIKNFETTIWSSRERKMITTTCVGMNKGLSTMICRSSKTSLIKGSTFVSQTHKQFKETKFKMHHHKAYALIVATSNSMAGSNWEWFLLQSINNCKPQILLFHGLESNLRCQKNGSQRNFFLFLFKRSCAPCQILFIVALGTIYVMNTSSNLIKACVSSFVYP